MFLSVLVFLLVLSILVIVHELGHYWVAKRNGIWVEEFGFGIPPRIFGKKIGETIYSINLLPFGGFVRLHGEMTEEGVTKPNRAFINKSLFAKTAVIVAGVVMNFLLAIVCFAIVYSHYGIPRELKEVKVLNIATNSPAQLAQILVGDRILSVDGVRVTNVPEFIEQIENKKGKKTVLQLQDRKVSVVPRVEPPQGEGPLGVSITSTENYFPPWWKMPFYGAYYGTKESFVWVGTVWGGLTNIAQDASQGKLSKEVSGPVGILAIIDRIVRSGDIWALINLIGIISVNLAVLNILPLPALDGGRQLFIFIEAIFGKKIAPKIESVVHGVGMILLLLLMLAITVKDIRAWIFAGSLSGFLDNMVK